VDEPLAPLARLSWDRAPELCRPEHGCLDYHRCWSMVRLLRQNGALPSGADFFLREIRTEASADRKRVLISGAADTGVPALILTAFEQADVFPELVIIDQCRTPILQNRTLFDSLRLKAEIRCGDICDLQCEPVDVVVAHSFLHFFPEPARSEVSRAWLRLLKPGGLLLLSNSVCPSESVGPPAKPPGLIEEQIPALVAAAVQAGMAEAEAAEFGALSGEFLRKNRWQRPYITEQNLIRNLIAAGFHIEQFKVVTAGNKAPSRAFATSTLTPQRVEVVARKGR